MRFRVAIRVERDARLQAVRNQWAGKLLADGGARVIQIEPPGGSPGRWCGPFVDDRVDPDRCLGRAAKRYNAPSFRGCGRPFQWCW